MVRGLAFSNNGDMYSASWDRTIRRWGVSPEEDQAEGIPEAVDTVVTSSPVVALVFHVGRQELFSGSVDGGIRVWSPALEPLRIFDVLDGAVETLALSRDDVLFSSSGDGTIKVGAALLHNLGLGESTLLCSRSPSQLTLLRCCSCGHPLLRLRSFLRAGMVTSVGNAQVYVQGSRGLCG
jgi:WD40 repeat protein